MSGEIVAATVILPGGGAAWDGYGAIRVMFGRDSRSGEPGVQIEQEGGGVPIVLAATQARALARAIDAMAGPDPAAPPLLPPLTAVQRAWVSAVAAMLPSEHRRQLHAWAERRWGSPRWATLDRVATAVWQFRIEGGS